ncbi:MAG: glycosyltransferase family 4 protein [Chloroflexi bacterium]|nr:glycosyltransferase family 4 protein [Chloroflexota bacterium]
MKDQPLHIGIQQRVLPAYRIPFFDQLAQQYLGKVSVFYGLPRKGEMLETNTVPQIALHTRGRNIHLFSELFYLCLQIGLISWLQSWQPDVLIMEANPRYLNSHRAIRWMKTHHRKVIGWGLGSSNVNGSLGEFRMKQRRKFILQFDALIAYSKQGAEEYQKLGYPAKRIFIAPNAAAARPVDPPPKRSLHYELNRPQILFVGRLQERKRVDMLIEACAKLPGELLPILHIVGDGPARTALEELAKEKFPETKFYGAMHGKELAALFQKADLFVLPGTGGLAVQEAMSYALPIIVGEADGTQNDLVRAENGWILDQGNAQELAEKMAEALGNISALRKKGSASFTIVHDEVNVEAMLQAFTKAIDTVLKGSEK